MNDYKAVSDNVLGRYVLTMVQLWTKVNCSLGDAIFIQNTDAEEANHSQPNMVTPLYIFWTILVLVVFDAFYSVAFLIVL